MGESVRGTEEPAWNPAQPGEHGAQLVPKTRNSPAQIQEASASGMPHPQEKRWVPSWTQFPAILWMFPDLYEHRLQY